LFAGAANARTARPIDRGIPAPGLLAQVMVAKYGDHCPLYRQQAIYRRAGVELERATLADWVGGASRLLQPLVAALGRYVLGAEKIHGDDTPVPVLDPGRGKTKRGRLWTYVRDDRRAASRDPPAVWYRYSPDRKGEHPRSHLKDFRGILQADAYAGFAALYESEQIIEASCWAHARRKFYDIYVSDRSPLAAEALQRIGALYAIEEKIRGRPAIERARARQEQASPLLLALISGFRQPCSGYRRNRRWPQRSTIAWYAGQRSPAIAMTAASRSTTTRPSARFVRWFSAGEITSSPDRMPVASGRRISIA